MIQQNSTMRLESQSLMDFGRERIMIPDKRIHGNSVILFRASKKNGMGSPCDIEDF
jgi:hypothetical protein